MKNTDKIRKINLTVLFLSTKKAWNILEIKEYAEIL